MVMSNICPQLKDRWEMTCKTIFGQSIGELPDFNLWLSELIEPVTEHKSNLSRKQVISAPTDYSNGSKWIAFNEIDFNKKYEPLGINEIKDIDSLAEAISEKWHYSGNVVFGRSRCIEKSSNINDSFYLFNCARFGNSKYLAYCTIGRSNEACFGCNVISESINCIRCFRSFRNKNSFELWMSQNCNECYYSYGLTNCVNNIFCFNIRNKRNAIGNLELDQSKYQSIKDKLLEEIVEEIRKKKRADSLLEIVSNKKDDKYGAIADDSSCITHNKEKIENAFSQTTNILFGKELRGIDEYREWLTKHTRKVDQYSSCISGKSLFMPPYANYPKLPKNRLMSMEQAEEYGKKNKLEHDDVKELNLNNAGVKLNKLAFFNVEFLEGKNINQIECAISVDSTNCYRSSVNEYAKYCGYCFWPRSSEYLFGCDSPFDSRFSINCYSCTSLTRCFEIDCCGYCSDCYFCHNCENVHDSMFCFNMKNKRNAIGNVVYSIDKYTKIKDSILEQIASELETNKNLRYDIYNIGSKWR